MTVKTYCEHVLGVGMDQAEFVVIHNCGVEGANRPRWSDGQKR